MCIYRVFSFFSYDDNIKTYIISASVRLQHAIFYSNDLYEYYNNNNNMCLGWRNSVARAPRFSASETNYVCSCPLVVGANRSVKFGVWSKYTTLIDGRSMSLNDYYYSYSIPLLYHRPRGGGLLKTVGGDDSVD